MQNQHILRSGLRQSFTPTPRAGVVPEVGVKLCTYLTLSLRVSLTSLNAQAGFSSEKPGILGETWAFNLGVEFCP
jgi:hypothetical protein